MYMTLNHIGDLANVLVLMIWVYVTAKPTVNRWATVKFLRTHPEAGVDEMVTPCRIAPTGEHYCPAADAGGIR